MQRNVTYYYYRPYLFGEGGERKKPFNFADWIIQFENEGKVLEHIELKSTTAKVDSHEFDKNDGIHYVCFVDVREQDFPSKVKDGMPQQDLELADNEYIGEDMYVLYDIKTNILMVQNNARSLTIGRVQEFINKNRIDDGNKVGFIPVTYRYSKNQIKSKKVRSIDITCDTLLGLQNEKSIAVKKLREAAHLMKSTSFHVKFTVGRAGKNSELSPQEAQDAIDDILSHSISASTAKITVKDQDAGKVEYIDLIQNKVMSVIKYSLPDRQRLNTETVMHKMKNEYFNNERLKEIVNERKDE